MQLSNNAKIGAAVGCLLVAGIILYFTTFKDMFGSSGGASGSDRMVLLCTNPKCDKAFKISYDDYGKLMQTDGANPMMMMMGPTPVNCKFCNQKTAVIANECPKCQNVFIPPNPMMMGQQSNDYTDRCPECKFSPIEEEMKKSK
ncbi:MAG: hypothetical protein A2Y07_08410 [Planctomycetes bacterium GWF2_50_10]|nr:MAG: hypothetical protein A2Y07_08410 [Planctomycetes bacterium GWF2_50_10]